MKVAVLSLAGVRSDTEQEYERYLLETLDAGTRQVPEQGRKIDLAVLPAHTALAFAMGCGLIPKGCSFAQTVEDYGKGALSFNEQYLQVHSRIAKKCGCYLVPGSFLEPLKTGETAGKKKLLNESAANCLDAGDDGTGAGVDVDSGMGRKAGSLYHSAALLDPKGKVIGVQRQTHLSREEKHLVFSRGTRLQVFPTPWSKVALVVGTDAWYPEVSRFLALQGAEIICHPGAIPGHWSSWHQFSGMWKEVQQNQFFCLESQLGATLWDRAFAGQSAVHAPCEMTAGNTGYLARGEVGQEVLTAWLDSEARKAVQENYPLLDLRNPQAYRRYLPGLYRLEKGDRTGSGKDAAGRGPDKTGEKKEERLEEGLEESKKKGARQKTSLHLETGPTRQQGQELPAGTKKAEEKSSKSGKETGKHRSGRRPSPLESWKAGLFLQYLGFKGRPSRIRRYLERSIRPVKTRKRPAPGRILRAAAVQVELSMYADPLDYAEEMRRHVEKAVDSGAELVVFPENNGLQLFGMLPGLSGQSREKESRWPSAEEELPVLEVIRYAGPVIEMVARETFSTLARLYGVHVMAGSFMLPRGSRVVNRAFLFGPEGQLLETQDKVHLFPTEVEWGLSPGDEFKVVQTEIGSLALPVCMDATYFETFRILRHLGAEVVMVPIADTAETYSPHLALRGIWPRVQESLVYGIKSALVGSFLDFTFTGKAGIYAPLELTPDKDGILAEAEKPHGSDLVVADLDLEALEKIRRQHTYLGDSNPLLYQNHLPSLYLERSLE